MDTDEAGATGRGH